ncbi:DNA-binding protein HEXBP-like [Haliotis rubra]|uniref:DNA-binding protein HEXBP-like n=1 Tax=Haliotis rubra TaxID=36100 RepID=UPI001EE541E8|nr:DNA-binding protein HEXBP-like [Haliotis rubra]
MACNVVNTAAGAVATACTGERKHCWKCPGSSDHVFEHCPKAVCGNRCGGSGHWGMQCPQPCTVCNVQGHYRRNCPKLGGGVMTAPARMVDAKAPTASVPRTPGKSGTPSYGQCYRCGSADHWSPNCPGAECYKCGEKGHYARRCPNDPAVCKKQKEVAESDLWDGEMVIPVEKCSKCLKKTCDVSTQTTGRWMSCSQFKGLGRRAG